MPTLSGGLLEVLDLVGLRPGAVEDLLHDLLEGLLIALEFVDYRKRLEELRHVRGETTLRMDQETEDTLKAVELAGNCHQTLKVALARIERLHKRLDCGVDLRGAPLEVVHLHS